MSANFTPNQNDYNNMTPFKTWLKYQINTWGLNSFPFVESDFDDLTNYAMMMKLMKHFNVLIENQNMVEEDMTNLYNAFTELQNYVNQYFDENFPELVNDKLDEMASDGTLANLLNNYANLIKVYNTYSEMIEDSTNFINGLRLKTMGYYNVNDGGNAEYFVSNNANLDGYKISLDNNLYLYITNQLINVKMLGAKYDENYDDTSIIMSSINTLGYAYLPSGTYYCNIEILNDNDVEIYGDETTILKPYDTTKEVIDITLNSITKLKSIHNLKIELTSVEIGVSIKLPSFVDNYFPQMIDVHDLKYECTNTFAGKCIEFNYLREFNVYNIEMKRDRGDDSVRTGIGFYCLSCMNLNIKNSSIGFFDKAIQIYNGTMSSEGILIDNVEMFFNNYGVHAQSNQSRAILNLRIINCMIDQIQQVGIYIDGVTTCNIINNWLSANIIGSNSIDIKSTNRENYGTIIANNTIWHNNKDNSYCIFIERSDGYNIRNTNISNNVIFNYHLNAILINYNSKAISDIKIIGNTFETTSSDANNKFLKYEYKPINEIITNNYNGGSPFVDNNLFLSNNLNAINRKILSQSDITIGSTIQNTAYKPLMLIINCHHAPNDENNGRIAVFVGDTASGVTERYTQKVPADSVNGFNQSVVVVVPPRCWYSIAPAHTAIDGVYGLYLN